MTLSLNSQPKKINLSPDRLIKDRLTKDRLIQKTISSSSNRIGLKLSQKIELLSIGLIVSPTPIYNLILTSIKVCLQIYLSISLITPMSIL
jgi:hypothetical protein